ncbi:hypothetical protein K3556_14135 [Aliiroseovarius sp. M344]|uniref:hypothetical protein n=1 Tax=Aliiroseovarius sp. M344 TaxID=2867010 RepID=UPI0021AD646A|nr:hypothetical protein [Aliiroseovarius sp. M344]UWQ14039.1 hypothetical protein K3556_14135 [Aliiroseovarius sp. M344]
MSMLLLTALTAAWAEQASAQEKNIPYCLHTEELAPHGIVLKMGEAYYRACRPRGGGGDLPWHQFILRINPAVVPDLMSRYSPTNLRVMERVDGTDRLKNAIRNKPITGIRLFGGVEYEAHEFTNAHSGDKPAGGVYIYRPTEDSDIPFHWVNCKGWAHMEEGRSLNCSVYIRNDNIVAKLLFIGSKERGTAFVDHFPGFAQDIEKVLAVANVTDRLDEMEAFLDIVE